MEIFFISGFLKFSYLIFFVFSSHELSQVILSGLGSDSNYEFYAPILSILIFLNTLVLIFRFEANAIKKITLVVAAIIFSIYIGCQNGFMAFYWFLNSALLPFLASAINNWRRNA
ncbi:hypothetical protein G6729_01705 [Polynucleobacter paneuropaeus]|nr:hypothetical protein G6729_01705 [Polynucleobacter paneuropaeus]